MDFCLYFSSTIKTVTEITAMHPKSKFLAPWRGFETTILFLLQMLRPLHSRFQKKILKIKHTVLSSGWWVISSWIPIEYQFKKQSHSALTCFAKISTYLDPSLFFAVHAFLSLSFRVEVDVSHFYICNTHFT
jgi:hypothetical protein